MYSGRSGVTSPGSSTTCCAARRVVKAEAEAAFVEAADGDVIFFAAGALESAAVHSLGTAKRSPAFAKALVPFSKAVIDHDSKS